MPEQETMSAAESVGARVMFWMWMTVVAGGFTAMAVVIGSGR